MKALEKDRTRRYKTADGLARDLERFLNEEPVEAHPPSAVYRFRRFTRRNKAALTTGAIVIAILLLGSVVSTWQAIPATRAEGTAQRRLQEEQFARKERGLVVTLTLLAASFWAVVFALRR